MHHGTNQVTTAASMLVR